MKTPKTDILETHGTIMGGLPPSAILYAAEEDLRRRERNKAGDTPERYAFQRSHVRRATTARMLIALALQSQQTGTMSFKKNTRLIYKDTETLKAAWLLAVEKYGSPTGDENNSTTPVDSLPEEAHKQSIETEAESLTQTGDDDDRSDHPADHQRQDRF